MNLETELDWEGYNLALEVEKLPASEQQTKIVMMLSAYREHLKNNQRIWVPNSHRVTMSRVWAMPNSETFKIPAIKKLLDYYVKDGKGWADPFAGNNSPAEFTNDLDPSTKADHHVTALSFAYWCYIGLKGVLIDPPYSGRQVKECYAKIGKIPHTDETNSYFYWSVKEKLASKIRPNGLAICFGWNSSGFGKKLGFELLKILLVNHGSSHNDTIVTVERKINETLEAVQHSPKGES